jgi:acyl-coenzyme A synthetase/AMP-(fatty) acid ligase
LLDGNIEYLGRSDNQVKIRGFRIELGEIETVLSQYPHVQASCVIVREDIPGDKRLVAYIVPQKEQRATVSELRSFLTQKLPEYMGPQAFVILDSLPLTLIFNPQDLIKPYRACNPGNSIDSGIFISYRAFAIL